MNNRKQSLSFNRLVCFISAPVSTDLQVVTKILSRKQIRVETANSVISSSKSLNNSITTAISRANFVIAVLDGSNDNVFYEIGYASALKKEIIILAPENLNLPIEIEGRAVLRADIFNIKALEFIIEQVLTRIITLEQRKSSPRHIDYEIIPDKIRLPNAQGQKPMPKPQKRIPKYRPLGKTANKYLDRLISFGSGIEHCHLEDIVYEVLQESGVSIMVRSADKDKSADIAIWIDELKSLSNPILIEIKTHINTIQQADTISKQLSEYMQQNRSRFAFVLFFKGIKKHYIHPWMESFIYFISVYDFIELLRTDNFKKVLQNIVKERYSEGSY